MRSQIETEENLGKIIIFDVDSEDFEMDSNGIEIAHRLRERRPEGRFYALRVGYKAVESFGGLRERSV